MNNFPIHPLVLISMYKLNFIDVMDVFCFNKYGHRRANMQIKLSENCGTIGSIYKLEQSKIGSVSPLHFYEIEALSNQKLIRSLLYIHDTLQTSHEQIDTNYRSFGIIEYTIRNRYFQYDMKPLLKKFSAYLSDGAFKIAGKIIRYCIVQFIKELVYFQLQIYSSKMLKEKERS